MNLHLKQDSREANEGSDLNLPRIYPEIYVPTATVILYHPDNPFLVLVGKSAKHEKPVLIGGKIDLVDCLGRTLEEGAIICGKREVGEEVSQFDIELKLLSVTRDPNRDIRIITASSLLGTISETQLGGLDRDSLVKAHYGVPDFLFYGAANLLQLKPTTELPTLNWIDIRTLLPNTLSAGHNKFIDLYTDRS